MTGSRMLMLVLMAAVVCAAGAGVGTATTYELTKVWESASGPSIEWLEYSPDATMVAIGYGDCKTRVWNTSTGIEITTLDKHTSMVQSVDWSPDGRTLLTCPRYGKLTLWNTSTWTEELEINEDWSALFSPNGDKIIAGGINLKVFDAATGLLINNFTLPDEADSHDNPMIQMDWSADNHHVAIGSIDGKVRIINTTTGVVEEEWSPCTPDKWVDTVKYSPDGTMLLINGADHITRIWDVSSMSVIHSIENGDYAEWSPDGTRVALLNDGIILWNLTTNTTVFYSDDSLDHHARIDWSPVPDDDRIVIGAANSVAKIWDTSGNVLHTLSISNPIGHLDEPITVKFSPDMMYVASGGRDGLIEIWNASTGDFVRALGGHNDNSIYSVAWSHDGTQLASGARDGYMRIWDWQNGSELLSFDLEALTGNRTVHSVVFSPDDSRVAAGVTGWGGANDSKLLVLDAMTGNSLMDVSVKIWPRYGETQDSISWSSDGTQIASLDGRRIVIWNASTGAEIRNMTLSEDVIRTAWSPDGAGIAAISNTLYADRTIPLDEGTLGVWNLTTDSYAELVVNDTSAYDYYVVWSPDSSMLLFNPYMIDMDGNILAELHSDAADWSPDGTKILSTSSRSVVLWNLSSVPLTLIITSPGSGTTVHTSTITVSGTASAESGIANVTVNGISATGTTSWSAEVTLTEGENMITVVATNTAGNTATETVTVRYEPLLGDLNSDGILAPADAAIALQIAVGSRPFDDAADVNSDGMVTSLDALMILQAAAGNIEL